ncbi:uncharacterized protein LOC114349839 [Ostrinia furnacalis]|uniref:uncharacterized protein LOC114349839 n=1 Tax=Ostrinia furnacalis TaxID=93504 RepID=UPI0010401353|nr:uncharacterized protein LOC114349839 [Ostrinia furnacalis]
MIISDLPEEVILIILRQLDLISLIKLYDASDDILRKVLTLPCAIKEWHMSLSCLATVQTFKCNLFKDAAHHLQVLNLCSVKDLRKTNIIPVLKRMKNLKSLDVSYTEIKFLDFFDMHDACPTINSLCINYSFEKGKVTFSESQVLRGQDVFEKMENLHLIGNAVNLLYTNVPGYFLQKANLNTLKCTIINEPTGYVECDGEFDGIIKFKQFFVYFMNLELSYGPYYGMSMFNMLIKEHYEFIIMYNRITLDDVIVYATPVFEEFFKEKFNIKIRGMPQYNNQLTGNMAVLIFKKEDTCFNNTFFSNLFHRLKDCFPVYFEYGSKNPVPDNFNWYYTTPTVPPIGDFIVEEPYEFKKKRIGIPNFILNLDEPLKSKNKVQLTVSFLLNYVTPITLTPSCDFLSKLTFLSLAGTVRYSVEFFNVLFRCCANLETLDIVASSVSPCVSSISRSVPLSKTLKNLRLTDRRFDYNTFFQSLSQCKTLENIHVLDRSSETTNLADPSTLIRNCKNLYSICLQACMSTATKKRMISVFNNAKSSMNMHHLDIKLCQIFLSHDVEGFEYEPFIHVFNVYPIKSDLKFL